MIHKVAAATLLSLVLPSWSLGESLRMLQRGNNPNSFFEEEASIECDVQVVMHIRPRGEEDYDDEEEDDANFLQCITDDISDDGVHTYEIRGLDPAELQRLTDEVTASEGWGGSHRYAFPGAVKKRQDGKAPGPKNKKSDGIGANILEVPMRGNSQKYQAINISPATKSAANSRRNNRNLGVKKQGVSSVLLLRVEAADSSTSCSHQDCAARTFGGVDSNGIEHGMTMTSQINDCSYGKLKFVPPEYDAVYPGLVNGTATVTLTQDVIGVHHGTVHDWVLAAAPAVVGSLDRFDHVMAFLPPGVAFGSGAAFAGGAKWSWFDDDYALSPGVVLHELGHNIGLGHSGGGETCYMATGWGKKCYNAPKSYWLGWYSDFHQFLDPVVTPSKLVEMVGIADYEEAMVSGDPSSQAIVLKIEMYESHNFYLAYNRREKMNNDEHHPNEITITGSHGDNGRSWLVAGLKPGQKHHIPLVAGSGMVLEILACHRYYGLIDTFAVSIHVVGVGEPMCIPSPPIPSWGHAYTGAISDMLMGYYDFDGDLLDSSGYGHHGTSIGGSLSYVNGMVGQALSLDGIDDFVSLPNANDFNVGMEDFTLTLWYRVSGDQSGAPAIITNKDWSSGLNPGWLVSSNYGPGSNGDDLSINLSDGTVRADTSQAMDVAFNTWHFVAVRIKRGEKMSLLRSLGTSYYLQEDAIDSLSGSLDSGLPILIGGSHGSTAKTKMDIDDLGIWRRALSSEEVDAIFRAGLDGKQLLQAMEIIPPERDSMPNTLIANFELESDTRDTSGNSMDAILEDGGGASFGTSGSGSFLTLDNINAPGKSFMTVPESSLLDFSTANFTVSFWHRTNVDFSSVSPSDPSIITNKNFASGSNPGFTIGVGSNGKLEYNSGDGVGSRCDYDGPAGTMNDGQWHFVALTQSQGASGQFAIYLDGKKVIQKSCSLATLLSGYPIKVGASWVYSSYYSGDVDKIMIFNSALSHANIFELYNAGRDVAMTYSPTTSMAPTEDPTQSPTKSPSLSPSKSPTSSPFSCDGVYDNVMCCGSDALKQADYRGFISQTASGIECQAWNSQTPHSHYRSPGYYPNSGLDSNYCRNPDGESRAWCYTTSSSTRWGYCDVPSCGTISIAPPTSMPTPRPTSGPSETPTSKPSSVPTSQPTASPTSKPTPEPTTAQPTPQPTLEPSHEPTPSPTDAPTFSPSASPSEKPTSSPTESPSKIPTLFPSHGPTVTPTNAPSFKPTNLPTSSPSKKPSSRPTPEPTPKPTLEPTSKPSESEVCTGIDNSCCGSFWYGIKQADYRGTVSKTVGGLECQAWSSQVPHRHSLTPSNYPNAGLDHNYCRNPDGEPRAWCYTSSSSRRWDYCDVPACPACNSGDPGQCGCSEVKQADYRGTISYTSDGEECQPWSEQSPHSHNRIPSNYPNSGLDSNYCRNPDGEPRAWCYTKNPSKRWGYCDVPVCGL